MNKNQKNAWMDSIIYKDWFLNNFVPEVEKFLKENKLPQKVVLVINNCPVHPGKDAPIYH